MRPVLGENEERRVDGHAGGQHEHAEPAVQVGQHRRGQLRLARHPQLLRPHLREWTNGKERTGGQHTAIHRAKRTKNRQGQERTIYASTAADTRSCCVHT